MYTTLILKSLVSLLLLISVPALGIYAYQNNISGFRDSLHYSVCDTPIYYSIGEVDPKFNLKEEALLKDIKQAAQTWNKEYGKDIFVHDSRGELDIHFIYDKKQELTETINKLEGKLNVGQQNLEKEIQAYETSVKSFEQKLETFNAEVKKWNDQGGAPPQEYEKLKKQEEELQSEGSSLNTLAEKLNIQAKNYNAQVGSLNSTINTFNEELSQKPEEGVYISGIHKIEIYFVPSNKEMIHTLAHEFGHSLGITHTEEDHKSIMYPYTSETVVLAKEDREALSQICEPKPIWSDYLSRLKVILEQFQSGLPS